MAGTTGILAGELKIMASSHLVGKHRYGTKGIPIFYREAVLDDPQFQREGSCYLNIYQLKSQGFQKNRILVLEYERISI